MKQIPLVVFGAGNVGRALVRQFVAARELHAGRDGLLFSVAAWCDHDGALVDEKGIPNEVLGAAMAAKAAGTPLAETGYGYRQSDLSAIVDVAGRDGCIVADVTSASETLPALLLALGRGYGVATANKVPLAGPQSVFDQLTQGRRQDSVTGGHFRYEATVGSAVPVVETALALMRAGDRVESVRGALSGTLGFLCTGLQSGSPFSQLVHEAMALNYTEPDPRVDLGGMDVARKALILARTLGWRLELADAEVAPLVPSHLGALPLDEFLRRLPDLDAGLASQVTAATSEGAALRFVAELKAGHIGVGLQRVPANSALGQLRGNDNLVAFSTGYYPDTPLVLQGRGAGVEAAAAGVHADIVALAHYQGR